MRETIISADDHIDLCYVPSDLWQKSVPARLRDQAPKVVALPTGAVWMREGTAWGVWGSKRADGRKVPYDEAGLPEEPEPGIWRATNAKYRLQDMDRDGVTAQVIYNFLDWSFTDPELKTACLEAFNSWLAEEFCAAAPDRLIGLATLPGHDPQTAVRELHRIARLGLKGAIFDVFGAAIPIFDRAWDPLWAAAAEAVIPISVHIGAGLHLFNRIPRTETWRVPARAAVSCMQLDEVVSAMILSGALERHPGLKFVLGESGIGWIPFVLERLDYETENHDRADGSRSSKTAPRELFNRQVYATFSDETFGVRFISEIGEDNVMWASDYPHGDGTFPHSAAVIERMLRGIAPEIKRKVLHTNVAKLYRLELK
jgi:predicted TIM-barrel fold metal-dependent hydrolase